MAQARKIALSHSSIATIETESFFRGKEAYLSFIGKDQEGQELAVLVAQADDAVYTYPLKEGVSSKEAASVVKEKSQDAIDRVIFGRFKGKPIWGSQGWEILLCGGFQDWKSHRCFLRFEEEI